MAHLSRIDPRIRQAATTSPSEVICALANTEKKSKNFTFHEHAPSSRGNNQREILFRQEVDKFVKETGFSVSVLDYLTNIGFIKIEGTAQDILNLAQQPQISGIQLIKN